MVMMMKTILVLVLALTPLGCSFYYSSESSAKSVTSPCRSSGSSSKDEEEKKEAYRNDVRDFTAAYATERGDMDAFARGLGEVARRHGITDWEADDTTWVAIGAGLKRAGVSTGVLASYETAVGGNHADKLALMRGGFES